MQLGNSVLKVIIFLVDPIVQLSVENAAHPELDLSGLQNYDFFIWELALAEKIKGIKLLGVEREGEAALAHPILVIEHQEYGPRSQVWLFLVFIDPSAEIYVHYHPLARADILVH